MSAASQSKVENIFLDFSFSSRNWGKEFQVSLSSLETGEKNFKFLFLLSIGLFGLSSMTGATGATNMFSTTKNSSTGSASILGLL